MGKKYQGSRCIIICILSPFSHYWACGSWLGGNVPAVIVIVKPVPPVLIEKRWRGDVVTNIDVWLYNLLLIVNCDSLPTDQPNWRFMKLQYWQRRLESLPVLRQRYIWGSLNVKKGLQKLTCNTCWNNYECHRCCSFSIPISSTLLWFSSIMLYQVCYLFSKPIFRCWALDSVNDIIVHGIPDKFVLSSYYCCKEQDFDKPHTPTY